MPQASSVEPFYPFYCSMGPLPIITVLAFERMKSFKICKAAFNLACSIIARRGLVEEFLATDIWPLSDGWKPVEIVREKVDWYPFPVPYP